MSADIASVISGTPAWTCAELVAPLDRQTFLGEYYDRRPVHLTGAPDRVRDLLSWSRLADLLAIGIATKPARAHGMG
ncbi:MAG: hypothetical protein H6843_05015 [Rhodospirillaceae bacterium]|nr:hypothetical protein [Rhodospirillaceae bacterium]